MKCHSTLFMALFSGSAQGGTKRVEEEEEEMGGLRITCWHMVFKWERRVEQAGNGGSCRLGLAQREKEEAKWGQARKGRKRKGEKKRWG